MLPAIPTNVSLASYLASLPRAVQETALRSLPGTDIEALDWDWRFWARPSQLPPGSARAENTRKDWTHWLPLAGRGWGKTRVGAETSKGWAENPTEKIHIVGPTSAAVRSVMIEGSSGLLSVYPPYRRPDWQASKHLIHFPSGAIGETFSADEPERLRGPACSKYWADEVCAWRFLQDAWDNLMFGFRMGNPQGVITTTPKPSKWLAELISDPDCVITRHATYENRQNLAPAFFKTIIRKYEGTRLGRQELLAEILTDIPGALWTLKMIEDHRAKLNQVPRENIVRIVVAIDPAVSVGEDSADTGIIVAGLTRNGHVLVLDDKTCHESPLGWARTAINAFDYWHADLIVGEINNGGDLVEANIRAVRKNIPFHKVRASRGKQVRAEPVATLYERGLVHHIGFFPELELQMTSWVPGTDNTKVDRIDALAWAAYELIFDSVLTSEVVIAAPEYRISIV